jgi:hypothetical protein
LSLLLVSERGVLRGYAFAILALISVALTPFGYMPASAADGSFILRICDGTVSMRDLPASLQGDHVAVSHSAMKGSGEPAGQGHDDDAHEVRCNYAITALADLPSSPQLALRLIEPQAVQAVLATPITGIFPAKLPPATGPPAP